MAKTCIKLKQEEVEALHNTLVHLVVNADCEGLPESIRGRNIEALRVAKKIKQMFENQQKGE